MCTIEWVMHEDGIMEAVMLEGITEGRGNP